MEVDQAEQTTGVEAADGVLEEDAEAARSETSQTKFTSHGAVPPVEDDMPAPPQAQRSPSERAYGRGAAPAAGVDRTALTATTTRVVHGVTIVAPAGAHAAAIDRCAEIIGLEIGRNKHAQKKLAEARASIVIIPARTRMTDVSQFSSLRGKKTFDGRDWSGVRGSGGMQAADGSFAIGVAEENLIPVKGVVSAYPTGYSIAMHELAHAVESKGMTAAEHARVKALYQQQISADRGNRNHTFTDNYAAANEQEYFAQATNAFFGRNAGRGTDGRVNANSREWLRLHDPDMYAFLVVFYETNHEADAE